MAVLGTGGTIAGEALAGDKVQAYQAGVRGVDRLLAEAGPLDGGPRLVSEQLAQIDSKDLDFALWA